MDVKHLKWQFEYMFWNLKQCDEENQKEIIPIIYFKIEIMMTISVVWWSYERVKRMLISKHLLHTVSTREEISFSERGISDSPADLAWGSSWTFGLANSPWIALKMMRQAERRSMEHTNEHMKSGWLLFPQLAPNLWGNSRLNVWRIDHLRLWVGCLILCFFFFFFFF